MTLKRLQSAADVTGSSLFLVFEDCVGIGNELTDIAALCRNHCEISQGTASATRG